jgi:hypothetical protein
MPQVNKLNPLIAFFDLAVVIRRIEPRRAKGIVRCQQSLHVAAHRLFRPKALDTRLSAFTIQFVGVGGHVPCFRCHVDKQPISGKGIEQFHRWRGRHHQR